MEGWEARETACWHWAGARGGRELRPQMRLDGKLLYVIRVIWEYYFQTPIPPGYELHHRHCNYTYCVNPYHVVCISKAEHNREHKLGLRSDACSRGHVWTAATTRLYKDGNRRCLTCIKEREHGATVPVRPGHDHVRPEGNGAAAPDQNPHRHDTED